MSIKNPCPTRTGIFILFLRFPGQGDDYRFMSDGGHIAQQWGGFEYAYLFGASLTIVSILFFRFKAGPHFEKNKLRG